MKHSGGSWAAEILDTASTRSGVNTLSPLHVSRYPHFFHFALCHLLLYGLAKDWVVVWFRKVPTKEEQQQASASTSGKRSAAGDNEPAADSGKEAKKSKRKDKHKGKKIDPVMANAAVLPHYVRKAITERGTQIKWTSRFKKRYSDVNKCVSFLLHHSDEV